MLPQQPWWICVVGPRRDETTTESQSAVPMAVRAYLEDHPTDHHWWPLLLGLVHPQEKCWRSQSGWRLTRSPGLQKVGWSSKHPVLQTHNDDQSCATHYTRASEWQIFADSVRRRHMAFPLFSIYISGKLVLFDGGLLKWWYPNSWMVYNGRSHSNVFFRATTMT